MVLIILIIAAYSNINLLILNAGVVFHPFKLTEDGFETHFQVNYLGKIEAFLELFSESNVMSDE